MGMHDTFVWQVDRVSDLVGGSHVVTGSRTARHLPLGDVSSSGLGGPFIRVMSMADPVLLSTL